MAKQLRITGAITQITAATFVSDLAKCGGAPVDVLINSEGGDVDAGFRMYDALIQYSGKVRCVVESLAASMASVVMLAGDEICVYQDAEVMIHPPEVVPPEGSRGTADNLEEQAAMLREVEARLLSVYAGKMGLEAEQVKALWNQSPYIGAKDALKLGLIDKVVSGVPDFASVAQIKLRGGEPHKIARLVAQAKGKKQMDEKQMQALRAKLGLAAEASADDIMAALDKALAEEAPAKEETEETEEAPAEDAEVAEALAKLPIKAQLAVLKRMAGASDGVEDRAALIAKLPENLRGVASKLSAQTLRAFVEVESRTAPAIPKARATSVSTVVVDEKKQETRARALVKSMGGRFEDHLARIKKADAAKGGSK
jgi:ATP-dependent protease ClpP protease subunit